MSMIPRQPPRMPQLGFLYLPPYRVQGISIGGEETVVQVPELDVCFDIGRCPKAALASPYVALTHTHMDHAAGMAYYFSQRNFQGMSAGTVVCHSHSAGPIENLMKAWGDLEGQRTPHNIIALEDGGEVEIKNSIFLRGFATYHTVPSLGYVVVERRAKLKAELVGLPQEKLIALKKQGQNITQTLEIPLVCYTGDTYWGEHFDRPDVLEAKILIVECTFLDPAHRDRAIIGKHLHLDDIVRLLKKCKAEAIVLTHLSRRTHMSLARKQIEAAIPDAERQRVHLLMDSRATRARYDQQLAQATPAAPEP